MSEKTSISREIRLFLSSTFRDMEEERTYLMAHVFPVFREECLARQVTLTEIDLRWGITEDDAKNGRTVEICLEEIERCRKIAPPPFFIGFLGERYGWVPKKEDLAPYWQAHQQAPFANRIMTALEEGISVTELEMRVGLLDDKTQDESARARIFLRAPELTDAFAKKAGATPGDVSFYDPANGRLEHLKQRLRASPAMGMDNYSSVRMFGDGVLAFLRAELDRFFPLDKAPSAEDLSEASHAAYAHSRRHAYVPLTDIEDAVLAAFRAARDVQDSRPIAIVAPSGMGKSAFLAHLKTRFAGPDRATVFDHYTGADGELSLTWWCTRLIDFLRRQGHLVSPVPNDEKGRWIILSSLLAETVKGLGQPLVLLLDALNLLEDRQAALSRLENLRLPEGVVLICTATPDVTLRGADVITLPPLDEARRAKVITTFSETYCKRMSDAQVQRIMTCPSCANPLFLRLVLEELRLYAQYTTLDATIGQLLSCRDAGALFRHILSTMDGDFSDAAHPALASQAARLITASWRGLRPTDLASLLAVAHDPVDPADGHPRLPALVLTPLLARFAPFCLHDDGRLAPMHAIVQHGVMEDADSVARTRHDLIHYFESRSDADAIAERVFQFHALGDTAGLVATLGDISATCTLWNLYPRLLQDALFWMGAGQAQPTPAMEELVKAWRTGFTRSVTLPTQADFVTIWLLQLSFLFPCENWAESIVEWGQVHERVSSASLNNLASLYRTEGRIHDAEPLFVKALAIRRKALPAGHPDIALSLNNLASLYQDEGRIHDAEPLFIEALAIRRKALPAGHPDIAASLNNLALVYQDEGRIHDAEPLLVEAQDINRKALPAGHPTVATGLNNLASLYQAEGRTSDAEPLYIEALDIQRKALPAGHPNIAFSLNNLASLYQAEGRFRDAEPLYIEALAIRRKALPAGHPDIANSLSNLASLYQAEGRTSDAKPLLVEALAIRRKALPAGHPAIATTLNNLASLYQDEGRIHDAEPLFIEALAIRRKALPAGHPTIATTLNNLALLYQAEGRFRDAEPLFVEALAIRRKALPAGHPDIATSLNNLALVYQDEGRIHDAEPLLVEALAINRKALPAGHPAVATSLSNLALLYQAEGRFRDAEPLFVETLAIRRKALPAGHPDIATSLNNLACLYQAEGRTSDAEPLYIEALAIRRRALPAGHPDIATTLNNLALVYKAEGRFRDAEPLLVEALDIQRKALPAGHPTVAIILNNLALVYQAESRFRDAEPLFVEALDIQRKALPADDPQIANTQSYLAALRRKMKMGPLQAAWSTFKKLTDL